MKTKEDVYNSILSIYLKTGQGLPKFVIEKAGVEDLANELEKERLIKLIIKNFNHLPDDKTYCLTKGYCVEEDMETSWRALTCLRVYLGIDPPIDLGNVAKHTIADLLKDPIFVVDYSAWLSKNIDQLKEMENLTPLDQADGSLDVHLIEYVKTREWYANNSTVSDCLDKMENKDQNFPQIISMMDKLISLTSNDDKYKEKNKKHILERENDIKEMDLRKAIRRWLGNQDSSEKIQNLIK